MQIERSIRLNKYLDGFSFIWKIKLCGEDRKIRIFLRCVLLFGAGFTTNRHKIETSSNSLFMDDKFMVVPAPERRFIKFDL